MTAEEIRAIAPAGIIFTGGPDSVYRQGSPACEKAVLELGIPVLGICYGMQLLCHLSGGVVGPCDRSEYGVVAAEPVSDVLGGLACFTTMYFTVYRKLKTGEPLGFSKKKTAQA